MRMPEPPEKKVGRAEVLDGPAPARSKDDVRAEVRGKMGRKTSFPVAKKTVNGKPVKRIQLQKVEPTQGSAAPVAAVEAETEKRAAGDGSEPFSVEFEIEGFGTATAKYDLVFPFDPERRDLSSQMIILGYSNDRERPFVPASNVPHALVVGTDCSNPMRFERIARLPHSFRSDRLGFTFLVFATVEEEAPERPVTESGIMEGVGFGGR